MFWYIFAYDSKILNWEFFIKYIIKYIIATSIESFEAYSFSKKMKILNEMVAITRYAFHIVKKGKLDNYVKERYFVLQS